MKPGMTIRSVALTTMAFRAVAAIAGMRLFDDQTDEILAAELFGQRPGRRLVAPHQGGVNDEAMVHAER